MAVVAVNKNGTEVIGDNLVRCRLNDHRWLEPCTEYRYLNKENTDFWACIYDNPDEGFQDIAIELPKGSILKLTGKELSWNDEPIELV